jgi:glucose/arabinose dehydrogenase
MFRLVARWRQIGSGIGIAAALGIASAACGGGGGGHGGGGGTKTVPALTLTAAFNNRSFNNPVKLVQHPTNADRWYVVEQGGLVRTFLASNTDPATTAADVDALVNLGTAEEQGLLGMAFDPGFATSHEVYFAYTDDGAGAVRLARWVSSDNGLTFAPDTNPIVLSIPHPLGNHNGSDIMFGTDGFLYYSMGDGGGSDDPDDNGQNRNALLGKILRIDVNGSPPIGKTYAIPSTNPFAINPQCNTGSGKGPCPEIFAYGFRNPWRMNFDPATQRLYAGDVGQNAQEEIDLVTLGGNYGWDCLEGELAHPTNASCGGPFVAPEAVHGRTDAKAITGGAVYRGASIPALNGFYVYGDFETGLFFAFDTSVPDAAVQRLSLPNTNVSAFGQGRDGEIYVVSFGTPSLSKVVPSSG